MLSDVLPHLRWSELDTMPCAVIVTDPAGTVTHWNRVAQAMYGWSPDEAVGRPIEELTVGPVLADIAADIMAALRAGQPFEGSFVAATRSGEPLPIRVVDVPLVAADGSVAGVAGFSCELDDKAVVPRACAVEFGALTEDPLRGVSSA